MQRLISIVQPKADAIQPQALDTVGPQVRLGRKAVVEHAGSGGLCHSPNPLVVVIQDRHALWCWRQRFDQLGLGFHDALQRSSSLQVHRPDNRDDADVRLGNPGQVSDLTHVVHAHLQHDTLVLVRQVHERQRQADFVVVAGLALQGDVAARQHRRRQFLGRRLAHAPRDTDDTDAVPAPPEGRHLLDGLETVGHPEHQRQRPLARQCWGRTGQIHRQPGKSYVSLDDCRHRPTSKGVSDVVVTIRAFPLERDEQRTRFNLARIDHSPGNGLFQSLRPAACQPLNHIRKCQPSPTHLTASATPVPSGGIPRTTNSREANR